MRPRRFLRVTADKRLVLAGLVLVFVATMVVRFPWAGLHRFMLYNVWVKSVQGEIVDAGYPRYARIKVRLTDRGAVMPRWIGESVSVRLIRGERNGSDTNYPQARIRSMFGRGLPVSISMLTVYVDIPGEVSQETWTYFFRNPDAIASTNDVPEIIRRAALLQFRGVPLVLTVSPVETRGWLNPLQKGQKRSATIEIGTRIISFEHAFENLPPGRDVTPDL